jgi:hypothetical protein
VAEAIKLMNLGEWEDLEMQNLDETKEKKDKKKKSKKDNKKKQTEGEAKVMMKIFGKKNPTDEDIKAKFGSLLPDLNTIYKKVDKATLKELTGSEKPTGKQIAAALKGKKLPSKMMNLQEKEEYRLQNLRETKEL